MTCFGVLLVAFVGFSFGKSGSGSKGTSTTSIGRLIAGDCDDYEDCEP